MHKLAFYGESTFRGLVGNQERDNPAPSGISNPDNASWCVVGTDVVDGTNYANVPRRVSERLDAAGISNYRENWAVSSTPVDRILSGGIGVPGGIATIEGGSEAVAVLLNTGINDAHVSATDTTTFRTRLKGVIDRALRTGKKVVLVHPSQVANTTSNARLLAYYNDFQTYLNGLGADFNTTNVIYKGASVAAGPDGIHPNNAGYEALSWALAEGAKGILADAQFERTIAQDFVAFFDRPIDGSGGPYWLGRLKTEGEQAVCTSLYANSPLMGLTSDQIVDKLFYNLFRLAPSQIVNRSAWVSHCNTYGAGHTAMSILQTTRGESGTTNKTLLIHRTNAGVAYGFRLKRTTANTTINGQITTSASSVYSALASV